jgi:CBS domain-containing protein
VWRVKNIMTQQTEFIPEYTTLQDASKTITESKSTTFLVGDWNHLAGIITRKTIDEAMGAGRGSHLIGSLATRQFEYLHADQPLELALERFSRNPGVLPVLSRSGNRKVEGVITIDTILKFIHTKPA